MSTSVLIALAVAGLLSGIAGLIYARVEARRIARISERLAFYTHSAFEDDNTE